MKITVRLATAQDSQAIYDLVHELALFVKSEDKLVVTPEMIEKDGFGKEPLFKAFVVEQNYEVVGMALFYPKYSTWKGKAIYLEDLVVKESCRGQKLGSLLFDKVVQYAKDWGAQRLDWQAYEWNTPAVKFYEKYGANIEKGWLNINFLPGQF